MSLFDKISKRLFSPDNKVNIHEILSRAPKFINEYKNWVNDPQFSTFRHDMLKSWSFKLNNIKSPVDMAVFISDYANGFTVYPKYQDTVIPLSFLMEYLKNQMLSTSYRLVHADRKINEKADHIETLEKYYLKPPPSLKAPMDQFYGNVIIELLKHDKIEIRLKFLASVYSDHKYSKHKEFNDLVTILFDN